jgi:hypothetical protein
MASQVPGVALRLNVLGTKVSRTAAVLPATATTAYFTVAGGRVIITALLGQVTTVCSATATTRASGTTPASGTASTTSIATATAVTSKEVGTGLTVLAASGVAGALVVGTNNSSALFLTPQGVVVNTGTIDFTTSATNTGATKWDLFYIPLDDGATVVTA